MLPERLHSVSYIMGSEEGDWPQKHTPDQKSNYNVDALSVSLVLLQKLKVIETS